METVISHTYMYIHVIPPDFSRSLLKLRPIAKAQMSNSPDLS